MRIVTVWNFHGELIGTSDDHKLCFPIPDIDHTSVIYITSAQDIIISLCEDAAGREASRQAGREASREAAVGGGDSDAPPKVSIHVSNVHTGKLLARIDQRALHDHSNITSLCYAEDACAIITGNEQGHVQVWSV